MQPTGRV